jgi:hypothetical protein
MDALALALKAKRNGADFHFANGKIVADLQHLPPTLRAQVRRRLGDVIACVSEHSEPVDLLGVPGTIVATARAIVNESKQIIK